MASSALFTVNQNWKRFKRPSTEEWINSVLPLQWRFISNENGHTTAEFNNVDESYRRYWKKEARHTHKNLLYDYIFIKFKDRQNLSVVLEIRIVITFRQEQGNDWMLFTQWGSWCVKVLLLNRGDGSYSNSSCAVNVGPMRSSLFLFTEKSLCAKNFWKILFWTLSHNWKYLVFFLMGKAVYEKWLKILHVHT